jgi:hypothetical protein
LAKRSERGECPVRPHKRMLCGTGCVTPIAGRSPRGMGYAPRVERLCGGVGPRRVNVPNGANAAYDRVAAKPSAEQQPVAMPSRRVPMDLNAGTYYLTPTARVGRNAIAVPPIAGTHGAELAFRNPGEPLHFDASHDGGSPGGIRPTRRFRHLG